MRSFSPLAAIPALFVVIAAAATQGTAIGLAQGQPSPLPFRLERRAEMKHHFLDVASLHEAVIRGDLPAARAAARVMVHMPVPPGTMTQAVPFVVAISTEAKRASSATTLAVAASATAAMLGQCGECHQTIGVHLALDAPSRSNTIGGVVGHMLEHQWAADELLQGLIIPGTAQWKLGEEALRTAPLESDEFPRDPKLNASLKRADDRVHAIAERAASASDPMSRQAVYAELLTTCAQCHSLHPEVWGPTRSR